MTQPWFKEDIARREGTDKLFSFPFITILFLIKVVNFFDFFFHEYCEVRLYFIFFWLLALLFIS